MVSERSLSQIATITMGTSPKGETYNQDGMGLPLLNGPTEFGPVYPNCTLFSTDSKRECVAGDLIFCVRGSTTGRMNWADRVYSLGRGVCSIKGKTPLDTRFIKYSIDLNLEALLKFAGGGTFPNLTQDTIRDFKISYPESRHKIAAVLSAYDDLIENNLCRIKILDEIAQNLYREWFVKFRFPGHEHARFVDSSLGQIPEGWEVVALESLISEHIGGGWGNDTYDNDHTESAWVIRGTDIPEGRYNNFLKVPQRYHTESNLRSRRLMSGDIVFEVSGGSKGQPVGRTLYMSSTHIGAFMGTPVICASFCKRIKPNEDRYASEMLYLSFVDAYTSGEIEQYQVQSTGITNFKWTEYIAKVNRCIPPKSIQTEFRGFCEPVLSAIATLGLKNNVLRHTRDLLLPKLISGEIDVSELDITVPEEVYHEG